MRRILAGVLLLAGVDAMAASRPAIEAEHAMVVSEQYLASQAGIDILRQGGNAVDAAVAVGYALAVTHPCCGNIGGGGFMLIHLKDGSEKIIDFREAAPLNASRDMYLDANGKPDRSASIVGWRAVAVPGSVAGFEAALSGFGRLPRAKVMAPAIALAKDGYVLTRGDADFFDYGRRKLTGDPVAVKIFAGPDGAALQPGDLLRQPDLAASLQVIAKEGAKGFYQGKLADAVVAASGGAGGLLQKADFEQYRAVMRDPIHCNYRGYQISTAPPPSSGGIGVCEMLNVIEPFDMAGFGFHSAQSAHVMVEAMRSTFRDRNSLLGDPAFTDNPIERLLSKEYADQNRALIKPDRATPSDQLPPGMLGREKPETTHYSVVDQEGNAVAVTYTLNGFFGAGVMAPGTGFFLNDEMDDFTAKVGTANMFGLQQGARNEIAPGKRPLSSMAPTIVSRNGQIFMVLGSPGGSRIATHILQSIVNVIDYGMRPQEAVDAPRFHHQFQPDKLYVEPFGFSPDTARILASMGYELADQPASGAIGLIERGLVPERSASGEPVSDQALSGGLRPGWYYGAMDSRRPAGAAVGY